MARLKDCDDFENSHNADLCVLRTGLKNLKLFFTGCVSLWLFSIFIFLSIPVYIYRYILSNILVPAYFSKNGIRKPVSSLGNLFATEFLTNFPPRNAIVSNFVFGGGRIQRHEILELIQTKWIDAKDDEDNPKYPELQQYIQYWMGFMFWKQDISFNLENHVEFHKIPNSKDKNMEDGNSEKYICNLMEELLNKPFLDQRSPWEIHILENYKNSKLLEEKNVNSNGHSEELTVFVLRFHHGLADGFSLLYAVAEGLFGVSLSEVSMPFDKESSQNSKKNQEFSLKNLFLFPWKLAYDIGLFSERIFNKRWTPWHIPDRKKKWHQIYSRSELIPIQKLKDIKNLFRTSFTGTLLSCISAGIQKSLSRNGHPGINDMTALSPLPLPKHPKQFRNHVTAAIFDLPTNPQFNSLERLIECEKRLQNAKQSTLPNFSVFYAKLIGSHFAPVAKKLLYNGLIPMGLSNFAGPGKDIYWNGKKALAGDFVAGAVTGVAGVGFMVLSYRGHIRIAVSAEHAIMEREDVDQLINFVCEEIDKLYILSTSSSSSFRKLC